MDTFVWSHLFETGLPEVDAQHRQLVGLVNQLGRDIHSASPEHIDAALDALVDYTLHHFRCEEGFMDQHGLAPDYVEKHRENHRKFVRQVALWIERRKHHEGIELQQLLEFLANWLIFHIMGDDQSLGRQVQAVRGGKPPQAAYEEDHASSDPRTDILLSALRRLYGDLVERNEALVGAQASLSALNATLEQRVTQRTVELQTVNLRLQEEQERLVEAEKMASLGRMVAGFAHELNTPIGVAVSATSQSRELISELQKLFTRDEVTEEQLQGCVAVLDETAELAMSNLLRAADMMKRFKRTAVDQTSEAVRDYVLAEVLEDVVKTLRNDFKKSAARIEVDCPASLQAHGEAGALMQVITNLVQNSLFHGFAEGTRPGTIRIHAWVSDGQVHIHYSDNGTGMSADTLAHVFEPFFTTSRAKGGSGLGMYIAYSLVTKSLKGSLQCESQPGCGVQFTIEFPQTNQPKETTPA